MAAQVQISSLAKKLGARLVQAHAQNKDKPVEFGGSRLPDGINDGVAQLTTCGFGEYKDGEMKGQPYFRAAGVMHEPKEVDGKQVAGKQTSIMIPLCDTPKRAKKKKFEDHYADFLNELKKLGVDMSKANAKDPTQVETYLNAAMSALMKAKPPVFFGVRTWKGKATKDFPNPLVNEEWEGLVNYTPNADPAAGVQEQQAPIEPPTQPELQTTEPFTEPPQGAPDEPTTVDMEASEDLAEQLAALAAVADEDVEGKTDDGVQAIEQLKAMAVEAGIPDQEVVDAPSYAAVAEMILAIMSAGEEQKSGPVVGETYSYRRRGPKGDPLLNAAKQPLPAVKVTVASVDEAASTVTVKGPDGKVLAGLDKKPVQVKFEWLEPLA